MSFMNKSIPRRGFLKSLGVAGAGAVLLKSNFAAATDSAAVSPDTSPNSPVNLLFDSWSVQVLDNRAASAYPPGFTPGSNMTQNGRRLAVILGALNSFGQTTNVDFNISYTNPTNSSNPTITPALLGGTDIYISLTRNTLSGFVYQESELAALQAFVNSGGSILLHTNHGPMSPTNDDYTVNDSALAGMFGVMLEPYFVTLDEYMVMDVKKTIPYIYNKAPTIVSHDSCVISVITPTVEFLSLAVFPARATAYNVITGKTTLLSSEKLSDQFAICVPYGAGKVIIVGNSGCLADYGSIGQSTGLISMESNLMFFLNCVSYLAGYDQIPVSGDGPDGPYVSS
jgi:hypothetical protein